MNTVLALSIALLTQGPGLGKEINFSAPAARLKLLLPELSRAAGVMLRAAPETENEVILLRLKGVTVKQAMDRIAEVDVAKWREDQGVYYLTRPREQAKEQEV